MQGWHYAIPAFSGFGVNYGYNLWQQFNKCSLLRNLHPAQIIAPRTDKVYLKEYQRSLGYQLMKLEFGGESPLTMRARCGAFRYCPDPLGIVSAEVLDKLGFSE